MGDGHAQYQFSFLPHISACEYQGMLLSSQRHCFTGTGVSGLPFAEIALGVLFPTFGDVPGNVHLRVEHCFKINSAYSWTLELCRIEAREPSFLQTGILRYSTSISLSFISTQSWRLKIRTVL